MTAKQVQEFKETEIGKIPADWEVKELKQVADVIDPHPSHRAPKEVQVGFPFAGIGDIDEDGTIDLESSRKISEEFVKQQEESYEINEYSIGYGRVGTVGKIVQLRKKEFRYALSPTLAVINPNKIINNIFLNYAIRTRSFSNQVYARMTGTTRPALGIQELRKILVVIPSIEEQKIIGKTLGELTCKILNLENQNKILEQTAQAIFKSWFVDFDGQTEFGDSELGKIPKGWSVDRLEKFVNYLVGFPFKSREFYKGKDGIKLARGDNVKQQELVWGLKTRLWKNVTPNLEKFLVKQNDILIGMDGSRVGYNFTIVYDFDLPILLVQRVARLRSKIDYYNEFVWQLIKDGNFTNYILSIYTGSAVPHISKEQILDFFVISPPENIIREFSTLTDSIRKIISKNKYQVNSLAKTRDALLPKLMSGEIRV